MATTDHSLRTLAQIAQARYEALMLLEVNGGQYTKFGGAREVALARQAWQDAINEQRRRKERLPDELTEV